MKMNEHGYDPKLKEAAEEIKAVLKKYDCLAAMVLVSPSHSEFLYHVESSWSVMKFEAVDRLRFKSKKEDFKNKEEQHFATESTVHALTTFIEFSLKTQNTMMNIVKELGKIMEIKWERWEN